MERKLPDSFQDGAMLLVNKPAGWTSFDVVNKVRYSLKRRLGVRKLKVGHAGTLDPMATGLLILCTGKWTKKIPLYQDLDKWYEASLHFGASTPSFDAETAINAHFPWDHINSESIHEAIKNFMGSIEQVPPVYSAIKVDGKPLYHYARKGKEIKIKARTVEIYAIQVREFQPPSLQLTVHCGKGTYIRSLAHDLGMALNSGAYLEGLVRTAIGPYKLEDAWQVEELVQAIESEVNV